VNSVINIRHDLEIFVRGNQLVLSTCVFTLFLLYISTGMTSQRRYCLYFDAGGLF
jgi:hypothetical protein